MVNQGLIIEAIVDGMENTDEIRQISFESKDGVSITADLYEIDNPKGFIVLCHMANSSRGEYREIAPKLNNLGFSCLAIDQRSGGSVNGVINETHTRASEKGLPTSYTDARPDMEAAVDYVFTKYGEPVILLGSSYSASLAPLISLNNHKIKASAAFSPGEYLKGIQLTTELKTLNKPTFVTSAKSEISNVSGVVKNVDPKYITHFKPNVSGVHGSKSLWGSMKDNEYYWEPLKEFLTTISEE